MSAEKISRAKFVEWTIQLIFFAFFSGGAYFMLKDHERRLGKLEEKAENFVLKEDFKGSIKSIWEAIR